MDGVKVKRDRDLLGLLPIARRKKQKTDCGYGGSSNSKQIVQCRPLKDGNPTCILELGVGDTNMVGRIAQMLQMDPDRIKIKVRKNPLEETLYEEDVYYDVLDAPRRRQKSKIVDPHAKQIVQCRPLKDGKPTCILELGVGYQCIDVLERIAHVLRMDSDRIKLKVPKNPLEETIYQVFYYDVLDASRRRKKSRIVDPNAKQEVPLHITYNRRNSTENCKRWHKQRLFYPRTLSLAKLLTEDPPIIQGELNS